VSDPSEPKVIVDCIDESLVDTGSGTSRSEAVDGGMPVELFTADNLVIRLQTATQELRYFELEKVRAADEW
jgi:hypothetical protein